MDIAIAGDKAELAVWMTYDGPPSPPATCTAECGVVEQELKLETPLPANVTEIVPVANAEMGC